jgi:hypothetical protein
MDTLSDVVGVACITFDKLSELFEGELDPLTASEEEGK